MDTLLFVVISIIIVLIIKKNYSLFKRVKNNKAYIQIYKDVLNNTENAYTNVCDYVNNEKSIEFKHKGLIIKLLAEVMNGLDYTETLNQIDLTKIFYNKKGLLDKSQIDFNTDSFIFIIMLMGKDSSIGKNIVSEYMLKKLNELELGNRLEKVLINDIGKCLLDQDNGSKLNDLLNGNYTDYSYDKNMISLYKRFAAATLVAKGNKIDDYANDDLHTFSKSMIGRIYMSDLGIFDKYNK